MRMASWWKRTDDARWAALEASMRTLSAQVLVAQRDAQNAQAAIVALAAQVGRMSRGVGDGRRVGLDTDIETLDAHNR